MKDLDIVYVNCSCHSPEHMLRWTYDPEDGSICIQILLADLRWYQRLWLGVKYIFGYKCRFGHFQEIVLDGQNREKLVTMIQNYDSYHKEHPPTWKVLDLKQVQEVQ